MKIKIAQLCKKEKKERNSIMPTETNEKNVGF